MCGRGGRRAWNQPGDGSSWWCLGLVTLLPHQLSVTQLQSSAVSPVSFTEMEPVRRVRSNYPSCPELLRSNLTVGPQTTSSGLTFLSSSPQTPRHLSGWPTNISHGRKET